MEKILVITYYWPPSGGSGVQRWMYFCKYLSNFNYTPIVLTVLGKKASYKNIDNSLVREIENIKVYKTSTLEPLKLYSFLTTFSIRKGIPQGHIGTDKKGMFHKLSSLIRSNLFIPDARIGWNLFALKQAKKIINLEKIKIIITTGPPHSTHLIAQRLKKKYPIKWIADFRDPWSDIYYNKDLKRICFAAQKDRNLEQKVLEQADIILTVGIKLKELLANKVSENKRGKFKYIYNGYDSFLMERISKKDHFGFEISFIGTLTDNQPYKSIIETLKKFLITNNALNIKLNLAGNIQSSILNEFKQQLKELNIDILGYISHEKAIELMKSSQLLLNCLAEMKNSQILISGKLMEYIATGNPILSFGDTKSEAALILKSIKNAKIFEKERTSEASQFIQFIYDKWMLKEPYINNIHDQNIKDKSRLETTRELSNLLNAI